MEVWRRVPAVIALATLLAAGAVVLDRPLLLAGAAVLGGWLLARQAWFARAAATTTAALDVTVAPELVGLLVDHGTPMGVEYVGYVSVGHGVYVVGEQPVSGVFHRSIPRKVTLSSALVVHTLNPLAGVPAVW